MRTKTCEKLFRLGKSIKNPDYDGRCKNQVKAIKEFSEGQLVLGRTWRFDNEINGTLYSHEENEYEVVVDGKRHYINNSEHKELSEQLDKEFNSNLSTVEPANLSEAASMARVGMETFLLYAVEQLVKENKLSPTELFEAYKRNDSE